MKLDYITALSLFLVLLSCDGSVVLASVNMAQLWMKVGTFAEYSFKVSTVFFLNETWMMLDATGVFRWQCIDLNESFAKINVSFTITGEEVNYHFSKIVYVNMNDRETILENGTTVGITRLWMPAYPEINDTVIEWDSPPLHANATVVGKGGNCGSPQGAQPQFSVDGKLINSERNVTLAFLDAMYDLDTGVVMQPSFKYEPMFLAFNIEWPGVSGTIVFSDTNIDLGPRDLWPEIVTYLIIAPPIAVVAGIIIFLYKRHKRKKI